MPEESGYALNELRVLQPQKEVLAIAGATVHPVPGVMNTHMVSDTHYHSDLGYAFIAKHLPASPPAEGESVDLRWMTVDQLGAAALKGEALQDVVDIYRSIVEQIVPAYHRIDVALFAIDKPSRSLLD